ncbi:helix-turn-helix domain-containing protein [Tunicatimonas pelagia]|uniref:helix-turn-helix domain-containing protein n=1 Tax=Tunicatimonas pelagia TaxID=931531 RepID=UPI002666576D|nr:helix-turn-helix domain-containing protein [Tunicatimonas pelagia]WKN43917.1 helix-turn-helix domain-containing protein [Tunicatimonas pelagia]
MKKAHVTLGEQDRQYLARLLQKGRLQARTYKRAVALLELDKGQTYTVVASIVQLSTVSLGKLAKKYHGQGLDCLYDAPRSGRPIRISPQQENQVILLSCSEAPKGYSQWSLRLLADKVVELGYCEHISHTQVNEILKKAD